MSTWNYFLNMKGNHEKSSITNMIVDCTDNIHHLMWQRTSKVNNNIKSKTKQKKRTTTCVLTIAICSHCNYSGKLVNCLQKKVTDCVICCRLFLILFSFRLYEGTFFHLTSSCELGNVFTFDKLLVLGYQVTPFCIEIVSGMKNYKCDGFFTYHWHSGRLF